MVTLSIREDMELDKPLPYIPINQKETVEDMDMVGADVNRGISSKFMIPLDTHTHEIK